MIGSSPVQLAFLVAAGLIAGAVNAVAGGGSLLVFPALLAVGFPPLAANVTNSVAQWPGYVGVVAGAALQGAADQGLVRIEPGDDEEIQRTLVAVADDYPWTDESSHGNARQRTAAFQQGVDEGVEACLRF